MDFSELKNNYSSYEQLLKEDLYKFKKQNLALKPNTNALNLSEEQAKEKLTTGPTSYNPNSSIMDIDPASALNSLGQSGINEKIGESAAANMNLSGSGATDAADVSSLSEIGGKVMGGAGESISFGTGVADTLSNVSSSEAESWANTGKLAFQGAQAGMKVGGPMGAVFGGVAGGVVGIADLIGDQNKRGQIKRDAYNNNLETMSTKREQEQRFKDGEQSLAKLTALRKNQLGYLDVNL